MLVEEARLSGSERSDNNRSLKTYLSLIGIDLKLAARQRIVIFFNYLFPLIVFFIFAAVFRARRDPAAMTYVLTMSVSLGVLATDCSAPAFARFRNGS